MVGLKFVYVHYSFFVLLNRARTRHVQYREVCNRAVCVELVFLWEITIDLTLKQRYIVNMFKTLISMHKIVPREINVFSTTRVMRKREISVLTNVLCCDGIICFVVDVTLGVLCSVVFSLNPLQCVERGLGILFGNNFHVNASTLHQRLPCSVT